MRYQPKDKKNLMKAALGQINSDSVITNVNLVNVITGEIYKADVYMYDGFISHVEYQTPGKISAVNEVIDGEGKYLIPGLIDAHMHIESSMMTPRNFAKATVPHGTTTVIIDPHEIANVVGVEGVKYMHDAGEGLPMRQLVDIPSCVPAVPGLENAGAEFFAKEIEELASLERVIGLAEVMDFVGVINGEDRMMDIIKAAQDKGLYIQGHAPFVSGRNLSAYFIGGPTTCHETRLGNEALDKMRCGMYVDARESSITKNIKEIVEYIKDKVTLYDHLCLCTDDVEADDILKHGQMNRVVNKAIECGLDPMIAIKSATYNTAKEINIENIGAMCPGFVADMLLVDDLKNINPSLVIYGGKKVAKDGKLLVEVQDKEYALEKVNTVHVKELSADDLTIKADVESGEVNVNVMVYPDLLLSNTYVEKMTFKVENHKVILNGNDLKFVAVINRHGKKNTIGLGIVKGFGTNCGALASTVSHDSHNLTVVYDRVENALIACRELINCGGGMSAVKDEKVLYTLELPVGGLMSLKPAEELALENQKMKEADYVLGLTEMENPLLRIVTLALPVIPEVKMSDLGLVDVNKKELIPLFAK